MLTEEKTAETAPQPELIAAAGRYYIMDRRSKPQDEPSEVHESTEESAPEAPISRTRTRYERRRSETGALGYLLLGALGIVAGVLTAVLYPLEGAEVFSAEGATFLGALADRLIQCGIFLVIEYILGYFAAGAMLVWALPAAYGLGAGLSAANAVMSGSPAMALPFAVYTCVICFAAARSAGFSAMLLSVVSGKGGSIVTDGRIGTEYNLKYGIYIMAISAAAVIEAAMAVI